MDGMTALKPPLSSLQESSLHGSPFHRTKLICTLGPASGSPVVLGNMLDKGMDVARLNFSHGTYRQHRAHVMELRRQAKSKGRSVALLQDLQGPKIRVGEMEQGVILVPGQSFIINTYERKGNVREASTTYSLLPKEVKPGDLLLLDDGLLTLRVLSKGRKHVKTQVLVGGPLLSHKGINLPMSNVSAPILSEKDREDIRLGQKLGVDMIALSFVRSSEDVLHARDYIRTLSKKEPFLIAKIERKEAVEHLRDIIQVADGIMVARGDLGVELGLSKVPCIQKEAITLANRAGKLVITATQMLESMIEHVHPTRAEVSDVANAVLDGTDAVMLSAETATGKYPEQAVEMMTTILQEIEQSTRFAEKQKARPLPKVQSTEDALARAAVAASEALQAACILVQDDGGSLVKALADCRPSGIIIALTTQVSLYKRWAAYFGVIPLLLSYRLSSDVKAFLQANPLLKRIFSPWRVGLPDQIVEVGWNQKTEKHYLQIHC